MSKKAYDRSKEHMNVGTIGHVDHGKTTTTLAIAEYLARENAANNKSRTFDEIDKAPEEKKRGITIVSSTIEYETESRHYSHTDAPGHSDYVKNMITGAAQMDTGILVVAATDGPMPQTREHILLAKQTGIEKIIVYINKADAADEEMIELVIEEVKELLEQYGYDAEATPFVVGSSLKAVEGDAAYQAKIGELIAALDKTPMPIQDDKKPFRMWIEKVLSIPGIGSVVTGKVNEGEIKVGEKAEIVGLGEKKISTTVTSIEIFNKTADFARAGDNAALRLRGVDKGDVKRGMVICKPSSIVPHKHITVESYIVKKEEGGRDNPFRPNYQPQVHIYTADLPGVIKEIKDEKGTNRDIAMPGDKVTLVIELQKEVAIQEGDKLSIREGGRTIGSGLTTQVK